MANTGAEVISVKSSQKNLTDQERNNHMSLNETLQ